MAYSSRLSGFYKKPLVERAAIVSQWAGLSHEEQAVFFGLTGLTPDKADKMIENVIGIYGLPLGVATNFVVNGRDLLIPMVVEEPSVVAAVSFAAKLARAKGGFIATSSDPVMIGQMQVLDVPDVWQAARQILDYRENLLGAVNDPSLTIVKLGGGARDIETRPFDDTPMGPMLVVHLLVDVRDAMGANVINTMCEQLAPIIENITGGRVNLRILSNYSDQRTATASVTLPAPALATDDMPGALVVDRILEAAVMAEVDPYRAVTHNKGIMNGIDAVALATGNDWRAIEAGAHAYASRNGRYTSMSQWWRDDNGDLKGSMTLPMAVGTVGGATHSHPVAQIAMKILKPHDAQHLSEIIVSVGLAQNFAAIRALATDGIQQGHMSLHARQIALAVGASGEQVDRIAAQMIEEGNIRLDRARQLLEEM